jgi:hypothetical protein
MAMASQFAEGGVLPDVPERQKILEEAGVVLAEARSLMECLDRTDGRLWPGGLLTSHIPSPRPLNSVRLHSGSRIDLSRF